jgi:hypothetical protein
MESSVLSVDEIQAILSARFICLKVDCDNPGKADNILSQVQGNTLPFYAYTTPEGKFISGTSGYRDVKTFKADLEAVLKNDLLRMPPEIEKKLAKIAEQAAKDFEEKKIAAVVKAARDADACRGFSDSKARVRELLAQVIAMGRARIKAAADLCKDGKFDEAGPILAALAKDYKGSELEHAASAANKALGFLKAAAKETEGGNAAAAKRQYGFIVKECKNAAPFVELAEARLKE